MSKVRLFMSVYLLSLDTVLALGLMILGILFLGEQIDIVLVSSILTVGINVLAIIFSVYFAALAIIISSGPDEFIKFLERNGHFTAILTTFRVTLIALFLSLVYSIGAYIFVEFCRASGESTIHRIVLLIFIPLATYSLIAANAMSLDAIRYAKERIAFIQQIADKRNEPNTQDQTTSNHGKDD